MEMIKEQSFISSVISELEYTGTSVLHAAVA